MAEGLNIFSKSVDGFSAWEEENLKNTGERKRG